MARSAPSRASSGDSPRAIPSSILWSRWKRSSSSSSSSTRRRRKIDRSRSGAVYHQCSRRTSGLRELDDVRDGGGEPPPVRRLGLELPPPEARDRVELRAPVVLGLLPLGPDPALLLELVERRVERS